MDKHFNKSKGHDLVVLIPIPKTARGLILREMA